MQLRQGEILFQGRLGFCVTQEPADRSVSTHISLLTLHGENRDARNFRSEYLNPLAGLLATNDVIPGYRLETKDLEVLRHFVECLRAGLVARPT